MRPRLTAVVLACLATALAATPPAAQPSVADFYKGKTVTCYIGYGAGGGYDVLARIIVRHMPKHIPGHPSIVPVNMPGASSIVLGNFLAKRAPRDGTAFGAISAGLLFERLFHGADAKSQFDGGELTNIGNVVTSASILVAWHTTGIKTLDELKRKPLIIGAATRSGDIYVLPLAIKNMLGLSQLKILTGYPGTREIALAIERGELTGMAWEMAGMQAVRPNWLTQGKINILAQLAPKKAPEVPASVPLAKDFVASTEDKEALDVIFNSTVLARPFVAPPTLPAERTKALREAFNATMMDPEFIAEMDKLKLDFEPTTGEEMDRIVRAAYSLPDVVVQKVRKALED